MGHDDGKIGERDEEYARAGLDACNIAGNQATFMAAKRFIALYLAMAAGGLGARLPLRFYSTEDGLPHNWVNCIVRDARGFLWFGTNEGLTRFDGRRFENFGTETGLPHRTVLQFLE